MNGRSCDYSRKKRFSPFPNKLHRNILTVGVHRANEATLLVDAVKSCKRRESTNEARRAEVVNGVTNFDVPLQIVGAGKTLSLSAVWLRLFISVACRPWCTDACKRARIRVCCFSVEYYRKRTGKHKGNLLVLLR